MNIPKGWKLVPEFPSIDMIKAGSASIDDNGGNARWADTRAAWAAMLDVAPTPPVQQDDEAMEVLRDLIEARDEFTEARGPQAIRSAGQRIRAAEMAARAFITKRGKK
jgi:hypothetical protein